MKKESSTPIFEVHLEEWNHALHIDGRGHHSPTQPLFDLLHKYGIFPTVYVLEDYNLELTEDQKVDLYWENGLGWEFKSHGVHHYYDEKADRSPYFNQEGQPGLCGGFFFRVLPLWLVKKEVERTGLFYIHPHDLDDRHPKIKNPVLNFKRQVGTKGALKKLERLLQTGIFSERST